MNFTIRTSRRADADLDSHFTFIRKRVSVQSAEAWRDGLLLRMQKLKDDPLVWPLADEAEDAGFELREILSGDIDMCIACCTASKEMSSAFFASAARHKIGFNPTNSSECVVTEDEWQTTELGNYLLDHIDRADLGGRGAKRTRKLRLIRCSAFRLAWNEMPDDLLRQAVVVAEKFADGECTLNGMYESRDFGPMQMLADAGCETPEIIDHCRGPGPHVRGCWVVDGMLGNS